MTFSLDVKEFAEEVALGVDEVRKSVALDLFSRIVLSTPVDTGRLRNNWVPSVGKPLKQTRAGLDKSGATKIQEMRVKVGAAKPEDSIYLSNDLDYAPVVEFGLYPNPPQTPELRKTPPGKTKNGFSTQAPEGMVRINVAKFQAALDEAVAKRRKS